MQAKFWLLEDLHKLLGEIGIGEGFADLITFLAACVSIYILVRIIDWLILKITMQIIKRAARHTKTVWDDYLVKRKFFNRILYLIPVVTLDLLAPVLLAGFDPKFVHGTDKLINSIVVLIILFSINSFINAAYDVYKTKPMAQQKSMKGYKQVANIVLFFIGGVIILAVLFEKSPWTLLASLGAAAALMTLVFKDTIMGFVASIQLSAQDMVRPGDWISMPSKNADGIVKDINVNSVKVQNWDNTITMIPVYSMVSEAFTNWRGMMTSGGRRFDRFLYIDLNTVVFFGDKLDEALKTNHILSPFRDQIIREAMRDNGELTTNLGLFRTYMRIYLYNHPLVNEELTLYVRYAEGQYDKGIGMELYGFCKEKDGEKFYPFISSVLEHALAMAPIFGLRIFQSVTGNMAADKPSEK